MSDFVFCVTDLLHKPFVWMFQAFKCFWDSGTQWGVPLLGNGASM